MHWGSGVWMVHRGWAHEHQQPRPTPAYCYLRAWQGMHFLTYLPTLTPRVHEGQAVTATMSLSSSAACFVQLLGLRGWMHRGT